MPSIRTRKIVNHGRIQIRSLHPPNRVTSVRQYLPCKEESQQPTHLTLPQSQQPSRRRCVTLGFGRRRRDYGRNALDDGHMYLNTSPIRDKQMGPCDVTKISVSKSECDVLTMDEMWS
ncbi:hypothetical protein AX14_013166 [Amanita brunnescens Koide BX004]|nr:hypothetical protein AX14_013166 [Amanita brunnescens Koide BX004]